MCTSCQTYSQRCEAENPKFAKHIASWINPYNPPVILRRTLYKPTRIGLISISQRLQRKMDKIVNNQAVKIKLSVKMSAGYVQRPYFFFSFFDPSLRLECLTFSVLDLSLCDKMICHFVPLGINCLPKLLTMKGLHTVNQLLIQEHIFQCCFNENLQN